MDKLKDALLKTFKPAIAIKVIPLGSSPVEKLVQEIHTVLKKRHTIILDETENTIYVEK